MSTYTYDTTTSIGKLRLNLGDTDVSQGGANAVFSDEELQLFLDQEEADSDRATGRALLVIANNQARRARAIRTGVLSQEMAVAELIQLAQRWLAGFEEPEPYLGTVQVDHDDFAFRDRMINEAVKE